MLDIHEVAARSGLAASALRYYEAQGLITSVGRRGLRRVFEPDILLRLALIQLGQRAGFSLVQIAQMVGGSAAPQIDRAQLSEQAELLDVKIRELSALRDALRHVTRCTAPSHLECPTFQRFMRVGIKRHRSRRKRAAGLGLEASARQSG